MANNYEKLRRMCELVSARESASENWHRTPHKALMLRYKRMQEYGDSHSAMMQAARDAQPELNRKYDDEADKAAHALLRADRAAYDAAFKAALDAAHEARDKAVAFCKAPSS